MIKRHCVILRNILDFCLKFKGKLLNAVANCLNNSHYKGEKI